MHLVIFTMFKPLCTDLIIFSHILQLIFEISFIKVSIKLFSIQSEAPFDLSLFADVIPCFW